MSVAEEKRTLGEPHDRLTRISARLMEAFDADPEFQEGDKLIVFLNNEKMSGIGVHGYGGETPDLDAMVDLFIHLKAVFKANGKDLQMHALREG
jgi:hypothetical protein